MKAERRHELQENQLAAWLAHKYVDVRPYVTTVVVALIALTLAWFAWSWYSSTTASAQAETWNRYYKALGETSASNDTPLREFIRDFPDDPAGIAARERLAIILMGKGANSQLTSRDASRAAYEEAIENFNVVRRETDDESLRRFASLHIALAHESRYDLEKALEEYEAVAKTWPGSAEADRAARRIEDLKNPATKELYDWHRTVNPLATAPLVPQVPIEPAADLGTLPDAPPADPMPPADAVPATPAPADSTPPAEGETTPGDVPTAKEKPADAPPAEEAPSGETPSDAKSTDDPPPADAPSPDEKPAETQG